MHINLHILKSMCFVITATMNGFNNDFIDWQWKIIIKLKNMCASRGGDIFFFFIKLAHFNFLCFLRGHFVVSHCFNLLTLNSPYRLESNALTALALK